MGWARTAMLKMSEYPCFQRLFPLEIASPMAIAAVDLNVETSAASLAWRMERTAARALGAWGRECHLRLVSLATGTDRPVREHARCLAASTWASFLYIGSGSRTFSATYGHCSATATDVAISCQTARATAPQACDSMAGDGIAPRSGFLPFGIRRGSSLFSMAASHIRS